MKKTFSNAWKIILLALVAVACQDRDVPTGVVPPVPDAPAGPSTQALTCTASIQEASVRCESDATKLPEGVSAAKIIGGQNLYVRMISTDVGYDSEREIFYGDISVQNLLGQAMGTEDGVQVHPDGIRVFHSSGPMITSGSGSASVANADGYDVFTGSDQPYFEYPQVLKPGETSAKKQWEWSIPRTAETFSFTVSVSAPLQHPHGWVEVDAGEFVGAVGDSLQIEAQAVTFAGKPSAADISWESQDESIARVTRDGVITIVGSGLTEVSATSGKATAAHIVVGTTAFLAVDSILPDVLGPGDTAIVYGRRLGGATALRVAGMDATVLEVRDVDLRVVLPSAEALPCVVDGTVEVEIEDPSTTVRRSHSFSAAHRVALASGESRILSAAEARCLALAEEGTYVLAATNTARTASSEVGFSLEGAISSEAPVLSRSLSASRSLSSSEGGLAHRHDQRLAANESILAQRSGPSQNILPTALPALGDIVTLRLPQWPSGDLCRDFTSVQARVAHVSPRTIVYEDISDPVAGRYDTEIGRVMDEFDERQYSVLTEYFADPLVLQGTRTPATERLSVLLSAKVNSMDVGFASAGDLYSRNDCAASNEREIVYLAVPTDPSTDVTKQSATRWERNIRATLVHEAKHVASFASRIAAGRGKWEERWLEEASAVAAVEIWARNHLPYDQFGNVGWDEVRCETDVTNPSCRSTPFALAGVLGQLASYHAAAGGLSPLGAVGGADATYYGSAWSLLRFAIDHSGVSEADFLRSLVGQGSARGADNLAAHAGRPWETLVSEWALASATDEQVTGGIAHPSWNLPSILDGVAGGSVPRTEVPSGAFRFQGVKVRGGSSVLFQVERVDGRALSLHGTGSVAPALSVVRTR